VVDIEKGGAAKPRLYSFYDRSRYTLHLMAFAAVVLGGEGVFAVVTGTARFASLHAPHADVLYTRLEGEYLGVTVGAFVHAEMEFMAELGFTRICLEGDGAGFEAVVALVAVSADGKRILAVMTGTTGIPLVHLAHGEMLGSCLVGECLGMAVLATVHARVDFMTEVHAGNPLDLEGDVLGFHALMAAAAAAGDGEGFLAVMAGTTSLSFFHLRHGDVLVFAGDNLCVVATPALAAGLCNMGLMAEHRLCRPFYLVGDAARLSLVATDAILLFRDTEGLDA